MLNKIIRLFRPQPSVASITAVFDKQVRALHKLADDKIDEVIACEAQIDGLRAQSLAANDEASSAKEVAARLEALIKV